MMRRLITCPKCGHDMYFDLLAKEPAPPTLIYECPACHEALRIPLDKTSNHKGKRARE